MSTLFTDLGESLGALRSINDYTKVLMTQKKSRLGAEYSYMVSGRWEQLYYGLTVTIQNTGARIEGTVVVSLKSPRGAVTNHTLVTGVSSDTLRKPRNIKNRLLEFVNELGVDYITNCMGSLIERNELDSMTSPVETLEKLADMSIRKSTHFDIHASRISATRINIDMGLGEVKAPNRGSLNFILDISLNPESQILHLRGFKTGNERSMENLSRLQTKPINIADTEYLNDILNLVTKPKTEKIKMSKVRRPSDIPQPEYYYLTSAQTKGVNMVELKRDIQRGVKTLTEHSYAEAYGSTRGSMSFMRGLLAIGGEEFVRAKRAVLSYDERKHFILRVHTFSGYELVFTGVSGGYWGEGTRGCHDILKVCGFSKEQYNRAFKEESFTVMKRK